MINPLVRVVGRGAWVASLMHRAFCAIDERPKKNLRGPKKVLTCVNELCYHVSIMSNSTLPKAVTDYFSSLGKRGGATKTRKGFAVGGDPREAQAKSVEARKRNTEARKAAQTAQSANGAKVQSSAKANQ